MMLAQTLTECIIKGKRVIYDTCSSKPLETAKVYYGDRYMYIGSSYTYYVNGVLQHSKKLHHFFIKRNKTL